MPVVSITLQSLYPRGHSMEHIEYESELAPVPIYTYWSRERTFLPLPGIDPRFLSRPARSYYSDLRYNESSCNRNKTKAKSVAIIIVLMMTMILVLIMKFNFMYTTHQAIFLSPSATQLIVGVYFTAAYRALASSRTRLLDHTQRRATVGRTPLNE